MPKREKSSLRKRAVSPVIRSRKMAPAARLALCSPALAMLTNRPMLAADIANTPENIWRWIQFPQLIKPGTEMAPLGMDGDEAAHLVKYLLTLK